eukprot:1474708-Rhodomonas_salina.1
MLSTTHSKRGQGNGGWMWLRRAEWSSEWRREEWEGGKSSADGDGYTPLYLAAWQGHAEAARALMVAGADKEAKDK